MRPRLPYRPCSWFLGWAWIKGAGLSCLPWQGRWDLRALVLTTRSRGVFVPRKKTVTKHVDILITSSSDAGSIPAASILTTYNKNSASKIHKYLKTLTFEQVFSWQSEFWCYIYNKEIKDTCQQSCVFMGNVFFLQQRRRWATAHSCWISRELRQVLVNSSNFGKVCRI